MYKRIGLIVTLILMLFTLTSCGGPESTYKSAQDLLSKGKYAEAAAKFESIGSYEDASTLTMYCKACALCEANNFEAGLAAFEMLGNFKDCSYRITYYEAREYEHEAGTTNWEYMLEAYDIYQQIPVFLDSADRSAALIENVYNLAIKAGESKVYPDTWDNPFNALYQLSEYKYKDSDKRITYYQIMFAEQYAFEDNDAFELLSLANRYADLGDYLDCEKRATAAEKKANQILDDAYKAAATLMRDGIAAAKVGDYITFGTYEQDNNTSNGTENIEWLVLAKENNRMLVISRYALDCNPYNKEDTSVTWETCTLRKWLNNDFLNAAFSSTEKVIIPTVTVSADKNPDYSTNPGNATQDKVFLLSIPEVNKYFTSDSARQCKPTAYAEKQGADTDNIGLCWWWLRSPGYYQNFAAFDYDGIDFVYGYNVDYDYSAVRPALWINLEP